MSFVNNFFLSFKVDDLLYPNPKKNRNTPNKYISCKRINHHKTPLDPHSSGYIGPWLLRRDVFFFDKISAPRSHRSPSDTPKWPSCWSSGMWMYLEIPRPSKISGHPVAVLWTQWFHQKSHKITAFCKDIRPKMAPGARIGTMSQQCLKPQVTSKVSGGQPALLGWLQFGVYSLWMFMGANKFEGHPYQKSATTINKNNQKTSKFSKQTHIQTKIKQTSNCI